MEGPERIRLISRLKTASARRLKLLDEIIEVPVSSNWATCDRGKAMTKEDRKKRAYKDMAGT